MNNRYWVDKGYITKDNIKRSVASEEKGALVRPYQSYDLAKEAFDEIRLENKEYKSILQESKNNVMFLYQLDYEERRDTNE